MSNSMSPTSLARFLRRRRNWRLPALVAGLTLPLAVSALAGPASTDQALARAMTQKPQSGWSSVILKVNGTFTPVQEAQITTLGGDVTRRLSIIQSLAVRVPSRNLQKLASLPFVTHLSLDGKMEKSDAFTVGSSEAGQATVMGRYGHAYQLTGQGITVAVLDSGVTPLPDLSSRFGDFYGQAPSRLIASVNLSTPLPGQARGVTYSASIKFRRHFLHQQRQQF